MKKLCLLLIAILVANFAFSEDNGDLKNRFYFRFGASMPGYGSDETGFLNSDLKRRGAEFELGSIFMLNKLRLADGMRFGINVDYLSLNYHNITYSFGFNENNIFIGSKIGPSFSYSPVKWLEFDTYVKLNPVWVAASYITTDDYGYDDNSQTYSGFLNLKYSFGFNIRMAIALIGFEYNPGGMKLNNTVSDQNYVNMYSEKIKMPCYNFTLGLSF
jgi:hypothetical protein